MKKVLLLLILAIVGITQGVMGQTVIQIGTGTATPSVGINPGSGANGASPYGINVSLGSGGKRLQILYTATQINAALTTAGLPTGVPYVISTASWDVSADVGATSRNQAGTTIKMKNTAATSLATGSPETGLTTVYGPSAITYPSGTGYLVTNTLATTFTWDGTSNLVVEYCYTFSGVGAASTYGGCRRTNTAVTQMIYNGGASVNCTSSFVTAVSAIPNMRVTVTPACTAPTTQATSFTSGSVFPTSCTVGATRGDGTGGVIIVARLNATAAVAPASTVSYSTTTFGTGTVGTNMTGAGNYVIYNSNSGVVSQSVTGLTGGNTYAFDFYEYNSASTCYKTPPLTGTVTTPVCMPPTVQASGTSTSGIGTTGATLNWSANGNGDAGVLVVLRATSSTPTDPTYGTTYTNNSVFGSGTQIGTGNYVVYKGTGSSVTVSNLLPNVNYTYSIYTYNAAGLCYMMGPATGSFTTSNAPMTYVSSTTVQQTGSVAQGSSNQAVLQVQVVGSTGTAPALDVNSITFNINGTSSLADVTGARIYYTGTSSTFATTTQFGADVTSFVSGLTPVTVTGTQALSPGTNYFWIVYDVAVAATVNNFIDGECLSIDIGSTVTPTVTAPSGARQIVSAMSLSCAYTITPSVAYSSITNLTSPSPTILATSASGAFNDVNFSALNIGFSFEYLGTTYTQFGVTDNGFIWLGSYAPVSATDYTPISSSVAYPAVICPLGYNLKGNITTNGSTRPNATISYRVSGTAPNRILTVQWEAMRPNASTGAAASNTDRIDFQVKLYENNPGGANSNKVEFAYIYQNPFGLSANNNGNRQVGFRGATNADFYNRTQSSGHWTTGSSISIGAAGSTNTAGARLSSTEWVDANPGGLTLTFTPTVATPIVTPSPTATNTCPGTTVALSTTSTAPTLQWFRNGVSISGASTSSYTATQSGSYVVKASNGSCGLPSVATVVTINACGPLLYNVTGTNSCTSSTIGVDNFETGVSYQLKLNGNNVGSPITTGTPGSPISFGAQTTPGTYTVVGTNGSGNTTMTGSVIVYGIPATPTGLVTQERCLTGNVTFTANNPGAGYEIQWSTDGVNHNGGVSLTYTVAVAPGSPVTMYARTRNTVGNCVSAWVPVVGIAHPAANAAVTASDLDVCFFDAIALLSAPDMVSYSWTGPNSFTSTDQNPFIDQVPLAATGTYNLSVVDTNGCSGSGSVTVTVHATCGTVTWEGDINTDWNIGGNWNGGFVPTQLNDALIPDVANDPSLTTGIDGALRHITVYPSATINVGTGKKIGIRGNWNGAYNTVTGAGSIEFNGALAQTITGGGIFTNITINNNNASGVTIASGSLNQVKISQGLNLQKATLTTNGNLYLTSTATQTAYINNFSTLYTGTINGTVTMERYNAGATGFRYLSMPINNPSINEINEVGLIGPDMGQLIATATCSPSNLAANSPYGNVMEWHENGPFNPPGCRQSGWFVRSAGILQNFRGYLVKMHQNSSVVVTGTPNLTSQTYATNLDNTNATGDGWHLMGNPYPSPVQWTGVSGFGDMNLFSTVGIYTGTYAAFAPVQNKIIATMQGFFVRRLSAGGMPFGLTNASRRAVSNITYQSNNDWFDHLLEIDIVGNGFGDHSTLYFNSGATADYEAYFDARKMDGRDDQPAIYTHLPNGTEQLGVNGLGSLDQTYAVPLVMKPGQNGEFTLNFSELATFPASAMIYLEDLQTGTLTDLRVSPSYTFTSDINDNPERFIIRFEPPVAATVADATCETAGSIEVIQQGNTVWSNYQLRDNNNNVHAQGSNFSGSITFANLAAQEYILKLVHPSGYTAEEFFTVNGVSTVAADMNVSDNSVAVNEAVTFTANVANASELVWDFGDGEQAIGNTVSHSYVIPGNYAVVLTASNDVCENVASDVVNVSAATGLNNTTAETLVINGYGAQVSVEFNNWGANKADIFVFNTLGQRVESFTGVSTVKGRQLITIADVKPGYYFIQVVSNGKVHGKKVYLGSN